MFVTVLYFITTVLIVNHYLSKTARVGSISLRRGRRNDNLSNSSEQGGLEGMRHCNCIAAHASCKQFFVVNVRSAALPTAPSSHECMHDLSTYNSKLVCCAEMGYLAGLQHLRSGVA